MKPQIILLYLGRIMIFMSSFLFFSFLISLFLNESSALPLLFTAIVSLIFGLFPIVFVDEKETINFQDGIIIVVLGWIITCIIGAIPYIIWGGEFDLANAVFESVSGFTTTGSTILKDVESLPKGLLFWRSTTHWIGGIGIILFVLLVLPEAQNSKLVLFNTEVSELSKSNFNFRAKTIVRILAVVYFSLTLAETLLLVFGGMSLFDAVNHSFATIATGGFSTKNLSVAYYDSVYIEVVIIIFMILSGIHFGLLFTTFTLKGRNIFSSSVARTYLIVMFVGILIVALKLYLSNFYGFWDSLRVAAFQVASVGTTTGFATADTANWPPFTQIVIMYFTIQCAMIGSTSGGLKFDRVFIFFKSVGKQIKMIKHPRAIISLRIDNTSISEQLELQVKVFIILYLFIIFLVTVILSFMDIDLMTSFSAAIATIGNVGPGFGEVSSMGNFSSLPDAAKYLLSINMLLGRLEIFNILAFFLMSYK